MFINWPAVNWGSVADWVSGLGSLSAAIVVLYLTRWSQSIRLRGYCGLRLLVGGDGPREELVFINVTNIGTRSTIVGNLGVRVGLVKKRFAITPMVKDQYSVGIHTLLLTGSRLIGPCRWTKRRRGFENYAETLLLRQWTCAR